jgi:Xaa-Pro aminopeptidase
MSGQRFMKHTLRLLAAALLVASPAQAQHEYQADFTADDFRARREAIYDAIGSNIAVIQGAADVQGFINFRQSNTFYYLSGLETPGSYMLLDGDSGTTTLYLPHRDPERERSEGPKISWEDHELVSEITGVEAVRPIEKMAVDFAGYLWWPSVPALYTPHSPDEKYLQSRDEILAGHGRRIADPWDGRPSRAGHFIHLLRTRYPQFEIRDLSPTLDDMRTIKDQKEIGLIRTASQLAGLGIMEAIRSTRPGVMEYQLEAAATFVFKTNGARGLSYNAIVGGGQNAWMGHYSANSDPVRDGDLILMDLAPDYRYYTSDVTRMWPANGKYSKDQRDLYGFVVEYHKAFMRYVRPGVTPSQILDEAAADMRKVLDETSFSKEIYRKACEDALEFRGHIQHPVGMSVHDVGRHRGKPLEPGMVFSIDPMVWVHDEELYIRMEDVVVVTEDGVENLSANLPIEMDDLEALWREDGIVQKRPAVMD